MVLETSCWRFERLFWHFNRPLAFWALHGASPNQRLCYGGEICSVDHCWALGNLNRHTPHTQLRSCSGKPKKGQFASQFAIRQKKGCFLSAFILLFLENQGEFTEVSAIREFGRVCEFLLFLDEQLSELREKNLLREPARESAFLWFRLLERPLNNLQQLVWEMMDDGSGSRTVKGLKTKHMQFQIHDWIRPTILE